MQALLEEVWRLPRGESDFVTVVVPEQFRRASLLSAAGRTSFRLKLRLLSEPGVVVTDVPVVTTRRGAGGPHAEASSSSACCSRTSTRAPMRAITYARVARRRRRAGGLVRVRRRGGRAGSAREWERAGIAMPLDLSDAPYRDIGTPLRAYLRELTADPDTVVNVVMPEMVVRGWARVLHNQRALYIKRLLLFERHVILSSVPYQLFRCRTDRVGFAVVPRRRRQHHGLERVLGAPALFATAYGNVGSSIYYALGLTAGIALGLTPIVFIISGLIFAATAATYAEGTVRYPEAGGSSSFARHAFNELVSFGAAWAQMLNYVITVAISVIFVPHYLSIFWEPLRTNPWDIIVGIVLTWLLVGINIVGIKEAANLNIFLAVIDFATQLLLVAARLLPDLPPARPARATSTSASRRAGARSCSRSRSR